METIIIIIITVVTIFLFKLFFKNQKWKVTTPPGPPGLPIIGNLHQFDNKTPLHLFFSKLSKKHGPLMSMKLGSKSIVVVSSSAMAEEVMKTLDHVFCNRGVQTGSMKLSYNATDIVFSACNDYWREMRKVCVHHLFNYKKVLSIRPVRVDEVSRTVKEIALDAGQSRPTNLCDVIMTLTSTIICRVAFGRDFGKDDPEGTVFYRLVGEVQEAMISFYFSDYFPAIGWMDKLTGSINRLENAFRKMDSLYQKFIDNHLAKSSSSMEYDDDDDDEHNNNSGGGDIIDALLKLRDEENSTKNNIVVTMDHIKAIIMNVIIAGTETSASVVVWAMTALIKSPTAMARVQAEIRELIGDKPMVEEEDCENFPYFKSVVKETMRMYPPVPLLIPRESSEKCTVGGYQIQPKTIVYVNAWEIGRDPQIWENPDEFLPERFLDSDVDYKGRHFALIPFGAGRRICPGMHMGVANVDLILANLLYLFDWSLPNGVKREDIDTEPLPGFGMHRKNPLYLRAKCYREILT